MPFFRKPSNATVIALLIVLLGNTVACRVQQPKKADSHPEIYTTDHMQYFPDGSKFKLSREAAEMRAAELRAARAEEELNPDR